MKRLIINSTIFTALFYASVLAGHVGPPELVNYQGRLTNNLGSPVADGNYNMIFRIYDAPTGGTLEWAETTTVAVAAGLLSVRLGSNHPLNVDIFQGVDPDFLEITVNGETLPIRTQMVSAPYSLNTARVTGDIVTGRDLSGKPFLQVKDTGSGATDLLMATDHNIFVNSQIGDPDQSDNRPPYGLSFTSTVELSSLPDTTLYGPGGFALVEHEGGTSREFTLTLEDLKAVVDSTDGAIVTSLSSRKGLVLTDDRTSSDPNQPDSASLSLAGLAFRDVGPNHVRYGPDGIFMTDPSGDTTLIITDYGIASNAIDFGIDGNDSPGDTVARIDTSGLVFKDAGPNHVRYGRDGIVMLNGSGDTTVEVSSGDLEVEVPVRVKNSSGDTTVSIDPNASLEIEEPVAQVKVKIRSGNNAMIAVKNLTNDTTVQLTMSGQMVLSDTGSSDKVMILNPRDGLVMVKKNTNDTTLRLAAGGDVEVESTLTVTGEVSVEDNSGNQKVSLKNDGTVRVTGELSVEADAGPSTTIAIGKRYRDNAIVAWGRVSAAGTLSNEFGVVSVAHATTGTYIITIDDTASLAGNFIPMVVPEVDAMPSSAATIRLAYVDQNGAAPFNKFTVYMINGSFAPTDEDFLFMVTAR